MENEQVNKNGKKKPDGNNLPGFNCFVLKIIAL